MGLGPSVVRLSKEPPFHLLCALAWGMTCSLRENVKVRSLVGLGFLPSTGAFLSRVHYAQA